MSIDERPDVSFQSHKGRCRGNQFFGFMLLLASIHRIGFACDLLDGGIRQDVQVLCRHTK